MPNSSLRVGAVVPSAGQGKRFGNKKQFKLLSQRPLLFHTITPFLKCDDIAEIVVVIPEEDLETISQELASFTSAKSVKTVAGGSQRQVSVLNGCLALSDNVEIIAVHDAVRPFVTTELISATIAGCGDADGCIAAIPSKDTVKQVSKNNIQSTIDRNSIWLAQTPQTFHKDILINALKQDMIATDEASMVEAAGGKVLVTEGFAGNFKITTTEDWQLAENIIND